VTEVQVLHAHGKMPLRNVTCEKEHRGRGREKEEKEKKKMRNDGKRLKNLFDIIMFKYS
jgi:hypothetical protein